jgi:hypothetical protein
MWKLNKLDKLIIQKLKWLLNLLNDHPMETSVCIIAVAAMLFTAVLLAASVQHPSDDYTKGYNDGFSEMNVTKYSVAEAVSNHNENDMFHSNSDYLNGYIRGYDEGLLKNADKIMGINCSR